MSWQDWPDPDDVAVDLDETTQALWASGIQDRPAHQPAAGRGSGSPVPPKHPATVSETTWRRWRLPALVVLVSTVLSVTAIVTMRSMYTQRLEQQESLSAISFGTSQLVVSAGGPRRDEAGRLLVLVQTPVQNSSAQTVSLSVRATSIQHAVLSAPAEVPELAAGRTGSIALRLAVDCSSVPPAQPAGELTNQVYAPPTTARTQWMDVTVGVGQAVFERRYLTANASRFTVDAALSMACDPLANGALRAVTSLDGAGHLVVQLTNSADIPVQVALLATDGLRASASPDLPRVLPVAETQEVTVMVSPDCAVLAREYGLKNPAPPLDVVVLPQVGDPSTGLEGPGVQDRTLSAGWVAQAVTRSCG